MREALGNVLGSRLQVRTTELIIYVIPENHIIFISLEIPYAKFLAIV